MNKAGAITACTSALLAAGAIAACGGSTPAHASDPFAELTTCLKSHPTLVEFDAYRQNAASPGPRTRAVAIWQNRKGEALAYVGGPMSDGITGAGAAAVDRAAGSVRFGFDPIADASDRQNISACIASVYGHSYRIPQPGSSAPAVRSRRASRATPPPAHPAPTSPSPAPASPAPTTPAAPTPTPPSTAPPAAASPCSYPNYPNSDTNHPCNPAAAAGGPAPQHNSINPTTGGYQVCDPATGKNCAN